MTFVPNSRMLPRFLWRPAVLFFAVAQVVLAFAPVMEFRFGPDARAHVEQAGIASHHAHNDADCAACTARHLAASSELASQGLVATTRNAHQTAFAAIETFQLSDWSQTQSRAPPAIA